MAHPFKQRTSPDDWSDADGFYRSYVENCERLGIMPIPWIEAQALMAEWSTAFAVGFYRSYVENCERLGIMPIPWIEAQALMAEWSTAFAVGRKTPPTYQ